MPAETGYSVGEDPSSLYFDQPLASGLATFFVEEGASSVLDIGCGGGQYVKFMDKLDLFVASGVDGNPLTPQMSDGLCFCADVARPLALGVSDWVMSLEVGEHIPAKFESTFIRNLHEHNRHGLVLSWALEGQDGIGHVNCRNNDYIKKVMRELGYVNDLTVEKRLRETATLPWFPNTLMVFRKRYLYEILVPATTDDDWIPIPIEHHQEWDRQVKAISGGLTIHKSAKGHWVGPDRECVEKMIPVRIFCTVQDMKRIVDFTAAHYQQEAVMYYVVSSDVAIKNYRG
jgi:hypothetical protein